jgi:hypothetical protein
MQLVGCDARVLSTRMSSDVRVVVTNLPGSAKVLYEPIRHVFRSANAWAGLLRKQNPITAVILATVMDNKNLSKKMGPLLCLFIPLS